MTPYRTKLENELAKLADVTVEQYKETDLIMVTYKGKEFAHFHNGLPELDVRMLAPFVKRHALGPPIESARHPNRSKSSRWRAMRYESEADVDALVALIKLLLAEEY